MPFHNIYIQSRFNIIPACQTRSLQVISLLERVFVAAVFTILPESTLSNEKTLPESSRSLNLGQER